MVEAPERIWTDDECHYETRNPQRSHAVEYLRADIAERENAELLAEVERVLSGNRYAQLEKIARERAEDLSRQLAEAVNEATQQKVERSHAERQLAEARAEVGRKDAAIERLLNAAECGVDLHNDEAGREAIRYARAVLSASAPTADGWRALDSAPKDTRVWAWGDNFHWRDGAVAIFHSDYNGHKDVVTKNGIAGTTFRVGDKDAPSMWCSLPSVPVGGSDA